MISDPIRALLAHPPDLPVRSGLAALEEAVLARGLAVVQAPPGTGKTTLVPPALVDIIDRRDGGIAPGRVIVTQPRRLAARAAASRLAWLIGEPVGQTVGYAVRGDRRVSAATRIEMVTTGVLLRRLHRDPDLPGVSAVVLDEVHERQLDGDLALALLTDVRANLREDLVLVAMSATVEADRTAAVLAAAGAGPGARAGAGAGDGLDQPVAAAPVIVVESPLHHVDEIWCPPPPRVSRFDPRGVDPRFLDHVAAIVRRALTERDGDLLVFVPGVSEIDALSRRLAGASGADIRALHGRLSHREQDLALTAGPRRRVVISTAVAESSLTVPGVRVVVDAGLARQPRADHRRGLAGLVTVSVSRAAAEQRAGRAGREAPGAVYRCWSSGEHLHLPAQPEPEIATADLTSFALELAQWGSPDGAGLALLDPPPEAAMATARATLVGLGAVTETGTITPRGRDIAAVAADPRLARALLDGAPLVGVRRAAEVVALLSEDLRVPGGDLVAGLRELRRGGPDRGAATAAWRTAVRRFEANLRSGRSAGGAGVRPDGQHQGGGSRRAEGHPEPRPAESGTSLSDHLGDDLAVGLVVALAHPDRIARRRPGGRTYLMAGGTGAALPPGQAALGSQSWLAVADADRSVGRSDATIRSAAPLDEDLALEAAPALWHEDESVTWRGDGLVARRSARLGAIELTSTPITNPSAHLVIAALHDALARDGLDLLPWSTAAVTLRRRMALLHRALSSPWPDVSDDALLAGLEHWLGPDLARVRGTRDLRRLDVVAAVRRLLPWPAAARFDLLAPERITVPSGSEVRLDYSGDAPVLAVRIQECFGWQDTPRVADGRVPVVLHLLSPARRTAAVTTDLRSFWRQGYPQARAELRGRYPKHAWPEDPLTEPPVRGVKRANRPSGPARG